MIWGIVAISLFFSARAESVRQGLFFKTSVFIDTCEQGVLIKRGFGKSRGTCANLCTEDSDCRRYMYCSSTSLCTLYLDGTDCTVTDGSTGCSCYKLKSSCDAANCRCPFGYYGTSCQNIIIDCKEAAILRLAIPAKSLLVMVQPTTAPRPFEVECFIVGGDGWTTVLKRDVSCSPENFNRSFTEYENGFGRAGNWFVGLRNLKYLLSNPSSRINIDLALYKMDGTWCKVYYDNFALVGTTYSLSLGGYLNSGCGDSLLGTKSLANNRFSTYDAGLAGTKTCASRFGGGWWFDDDADCTHSFLTGNMTDIIWTSWGNDKIGRASFGLLRLT